MGVGKMNRRLHRILASALVALACWLPAMRCAEAVDAWAGAAQVLGVAFAYKACLKSILEIGNTVESQIAGWKQDMKENGQDDNALDIEVTNQVMEQLVSRGEYVLKVNSLPFLWGVNNSDLFNAACYPTDYISINRGLVRGMDCDADELAAVFAHEMTHGLMQHSAYNYAMAVAQYYGMAFLNIDTNAMDWNAMNALASYSLAKNITLPTEYAADEGGFYLMTSAGFNPGGGAAAMVRMQDYFQNQTTNLWEYQDEEDKIRDLSDHPDEEQREKRLADMMTAYSCGHVTVKDRKTVCIDEKPLLDADWTKEAYDNTAENAYLIAGGLARAFHDFPSIAGWDFRQEGNRRLDYLDDGRAYALLKTFVARNRREEDLQRMVQEAYDAEQQTQARQEMLAGEQKRSAKWAKDREAVLNADKNAVKRLRENGDAYSDFGMGEKALIEVSRAFPCKNQENMAENYAIRGRAKAVCEDFAGGLADADRAVSMDGENPYNYLNRADVYRMQGDAEKALEDCHKALSLDEKNAAGHFLAASIYDELGDHEKALEHYRAYDKLRPKAQNIPEEYMKELHPEKAPKTDKKDSPS